MLMSYILSYLQIPAALASACKQKTYVAAQFKLDIYTHVTLDSLNKFIRSLASCMRGLNKFIRLLLNCMLALKKFVGPLASCMRAHDLMHS